MSDPAAQVDQPRPERKESSLWTRTAIDQARAAVAAALTIEQAETKAFIQRMRAIVESRCTGTETERTENHPSDRPCDE